MGRRSRRAPALTLMRESLFAREDGESAGGESFSGEGAIFLEGVGLGGEEEFFAAAGGAGVELDDAGYQLVGFGGEIGGGNDLRDEANFQGFLWSERLAEENERKGEAREGVFAEVGHDGRGGEAVGHFGEAEGGGVGDEREVCDDGQAHAETEGVALDFGGGGWGRSPDQAFEG